MTGIEYLTQRGIEIDGNVKELHKELTLNDTEIIKWAINKNAGWQDIDFLLGFCRKHKKF